MSTRTDSNQLGDGDDVLDWIDAAVVSLNLPVRRLDDGVSNDIVRAARERYVSGNPRAWWMSLREPVTQCDSTERAILDVLPDASSHVWLVPETGRDEMPVYEVPREVLPRLIAECPFFEYYVLGRDLSWLVAESDHNVYFVVRHQP